MLIHVLREENKTLFISSENQAAFFFASLWYLEMQTLIVGMHIAKQCKMKNGKEYVRTNLSLFEFDFTFFLDLCKWRGAYIYQKISGWNLIPRYAGAGNLAL